MHPLSLEHFWPTSTLLHGHLALAAVSLPETDPQILERWGYADEVHLGKSFQAKDFGLECLRDVQRPSWILHIGSVSVCLSSSVKSMKTSALHILEYATPLSCIWWVEDNGSHRCIVSLTLLHHSHCTFVTILFWTFRLAVHQPDGVHTSTFHRIWNHSWSCRTSILEGATFHRMNWCKFLWCNPCRAIETFFHWDSCLWDFGFSTHFSNSAAWKNSETDSAVSILHAYWYRDGNCNCLLQNTARWFSIANNLPEFFVHAVLSPDSWPRRSSQNFRFWPQSSYFEFPARYFFSPLSSICDNQVLTSFGESPYCTIPTRSWVSQTLVFFFCTILPRCHQMGFSS